jgi:hypothetical protein
MEISRRVTTMESYDITCPNPALMAQVKQYLTDSGVDYDDYETMISVDAGAVFKEMDDVEQILAKHGDVKTDAKKWRMIPAHYEK